MEMARNLLYGSYGRRGNEETDNARIMEEKGASMV